MKKVLSSMAVLAVGAAVAPSAPAQDKPWNVSASLRGFYDDNYTTAAKPAPKLHSFGFEVSPSVSYRLAFDPTVITAGYKYGMRYFEDRASRNISSIDQSHDLNLKLVHQFPERYRLEVSDNFVVSQEPTLDSGVNSLPFRSNGNNIRNVANGIFSGELNPTFGYDVSYGNTFYDYSAKGTNSYSALLDRVEHLAGANLRWNATQSTTALVGYQFGIVDMTSNDRIFKDRDHTLVAPASSRDNTSHYGFVGAEQLITRQLKATGRVGVQYTDYSNAVPKTSNVSPYVDANATWEYLPGSTVMLGVKHARNATDVSTGTLDAESTAVYGQWSHKLTPQMTASLLGQFQSSAFNRGLDNNKAENLLMAGVNLSYEVIKNRLSTEVGYNFDRLDSDLTGRSYSRNRCYIGIRASY